MTTQIFRKAILKKNVGTNPKLKKGEEVEIQETPLGRGRTNYFAYGKDEFAGVKVTRSEFDYAEQEEFVVYVTRTVSACKEIIVKAIDKKEAERKALEEAGNHDFGSGDNAEYSTHMSALSIAEHKNMFPDSNLLK